MRAIAGVDRTNKTFPKSRFSIERRAIRWHCELNSPRYQAESSLQSLKAERLRSQSGAPALCFHRVLNGILARLLDHLLDHNRTGLALRCDVGVDE